MTEERMINMEEKDLELQPEDEFLEGWDETPPETEHEDELPDEGGENDACPSTEDEPSLEGFAPPGELEMRSDLLEFARCFPAAAMDPDSIPPTVWAQVGQGRSLTVAYGQWALEQERGRRTAAEQRSGELDRIRRNGRRSTGSMRTSGESVRKRDAFLEGWGD